MDNVILKRKVRFTIHGFAVAHAAVAFAAAQLLVADKLILTGLTASMFVTLAIQCKVDVDRSLAVGIAGLLVAEFLGVYGALLLVQWIPFFGNIANSITTFTVTEILGWSIFKLFSVIGDGNIDWSGLTPTEKKRIIKSVVKSGKNMQEVESTHMNKILNKLTRSDRKEYDRIKKEMKKIGKDDIDERNLLVEEMSELLSKYE